MTTEEKLEQFLSDWSETDLQVRVKALEVLSEKEINGDSYGVPAIEDIVDSLVNTIHKLRRELP